MKKHIPNLITSLNLISGFVAIIYALNGNIVTASWLILAAMVFDFCDGLSARMLKAYSNIGKELDSLADIVSFGVAPAIIVYQLIIRSMMLNAPMLFNTETWNVSKIILLLPVIMPICGALRLAKFNVDDTQTTSFKGLPIPANALAVISIVIAWHYAPSNILALFIQSDIAILIFTFIVSLLMVTRLPLLALKTSHLRFRGNEGRYLMIVLVAVTLAVFGIGAAPLIIPLYIIASFISLAIK
jgi:CDP-diacylglycerol--serine O-phosphatidyltransferase